MLTALHVENIAIIDRLDIEFQNGFTVLTGETGAGKSIIIDSILLLLGNKASKDLIRSGAEAGIVSACFCALSAEALEILGKNGLSPDEEGNITIYRKIGIDGKNNARINGITVTVSILRELGEHLVNIHGQHDGVLLLDSKRHLSYLDEFGAVDTELYRVCYEKVKKLRVQLSEMQLKEAEKERRREQLLIWLKQLDDCALQEGEHDDLLSRRKNMLTNGEIIEGLHAAATAVYDGELPAAQLVREALDAMLSIEKLLPQGEELTRRLSLASAELDDLGAELGKLFDDYASDQMDPQEIEERLDQIEQIKKAFGPTDRDVLDHQAAYRDELDALDHSEDRIHQLEQDFLEARAELDRCAADLTEKRQKTAKEMEWRLRNELVYLDMPKVQFMVRVQDRLNDRGGIRYRPDGKDDVEFFLSANAGETLRPLAKIASGGELSRIMLSMKSVLNQGFDTVVYDEVDTGVSGATADKIGKKLQSGAEGRQVFCITHLAQIAARADHHLKVVKQEIKGRVSSSVHTLNEEERVREVARIMGGEELTETLLQSAKEIITNSKNKD
ncbi:MAG: DNA repair protein RecN [Clostridia bacterium]|nr:DNA repair protein RecN [Clostridia bacterium]